MSRSDEDRRHARSGVRRSAGARELIDAGVDVVRLNLSHGELDEHLDRLARVRQAAADIGRQVAVLADLPGPKIRTGQFPDGGVASGRRAASSTLRPGDGPSDAMCITVQYPTLLDDLVVGSRVQLGDGAISMSSSPSTTTGPAR